MHTRFWQSYFTGLAVMAALGLGAAALKAQAAPTLMPLATFNNTNGNSPQGGVTRDAAGDLFGTTGGGDANGDGTIFEIAAGTSTITTLAKFNGTNGSGPAGGATVDSQGNLYGTTNTGGAASVGTIWELPHGSSVVVTLASFNGSGNGSNPQSGVTIDAGGNLFGTTSAGGSSNNGTVFELARGSGVIQTLGTFPMANLQGFPPSPVTIDRSGNLFGTTYGDGYGTGGGSSGAVWEIPAGATGLTTLADFSATDSRGANADGAGPDGGLTLDNQGNLYGTTHFGGSGTNGTVFEIAAGTSTIINLANFPFGEAEGSGPSGHLARDSSGNLFGTTTNGGSNAIGSNDGTVFEIVVGSGTVTTLATFAGSDGNTPMAGVIVDPGGNLFGTTPFGGGGGVGEVFEVAGAGTPAPSPAQLLWNNVSGQAALWNINPDGTFTSAAYGPFSGWTAKAVSEAPDGADWLLWTNTNGTAALWRVSALTPNGYTTVQYGPYPNFAAVSLSIGADGNPRLLWNETSGAASLWDINKSTGAFTHAEYGPFAGWTANQVASGATVTDLLWTNTNGTAAGWRISNASGSITNAAFGPYNSYSAVGLSVGPDDGAHLLWDSTSGTEALWSADFTSGAFTATSYGPFSGYTARAIAVGPDNGTRLLWDNTNGTASLWDVTGSGFTHEEFGPFSGWTAVAVSAGL